MVKFSGVKNGRAFIGLGLSEVNIIKLKRGKPILIKGEETELPHDILIFYGIDEKSMKEMCKPFIGKDTIIIEE